MCYYQVRTGAASRQAARRRSRSNVRFSVRIHPGRRGHVLPAGRRLAPLPMGRKDPGRGRRLVPPGPRHGRVQVPHAELEHRGQSLLVR